MKYTAINIGPIIGTLSMARKPRELWSASYLFSFLMECIIKEIKKEEKTTIISPASIAEVDNLYKEVGLYPDRVFIAGLNESQVKRVCENALAVFSGITGIGTEYVNIMHVSVESENGIGIIQKLNRLLDCVELVNRPVTEAERGKVMELIQKKSVSPLFRYATEGKTWNVQTLAEIATYQCSTLEKSKTWEQLCSEMRKTDKDQDKTQGNGEDEFYRQIKLTFKSEYRSYYKYICVVQADGDNMGKIVSSLKNAEVEKLSSALLAYGSEASRLIKLYGGMPIYAGGDDLLFIAPVVSTKENAAKGMGNIFELLATIDCLYQSKVDAVMGNGQGKIGRPKDKDDKEIHTTISYGLSISYYKYPLYEALTSARELLFDTAKHIKGKNAVAWCLRKHSGSGFVGSFTKGASKEIYSIFDELIKSQADETLISAIAHKLRANADLVDLLRGKDEKRIGAFYHKTMEEKEPDDKSYMGITRRLLCALLRDYNDRPDVKIEEILEKMYGMLRTAKFINGEGDRDE